MSAECSGQPSRKRVQPVKTPLTAGPDALPSMPPSEDQGGARRHETDLTFPKLSRRSLDIVARGGLDRKKCLRAHVKVCARLRREASRAMPSRYAKSKTRGMRMYEEFSKGAQKEGL